MKTLYFVKEYRNGENLTRHVSRREEQARQRFEGLKNGAHPVWLERVEELAANDMLQTLRSEL